MSSLRALALAGLVSSSFACSEPGGREQVELPSTEQAYRVSSRPSLQWKRYAALEADLARALELDRDALCNEFGKESCIRRVHLVPLGGHDPFGTGLLQPSAEPLATTPLAVDRILLSACGQRVALDREAGREEAQVFNAIDLEGDAPGPESADVRQTIIDLYRRLLGRDPDAHEVPLLAALTRDKEGEPRRAREFATLTCFAIGTTTEFLFF